MNAPRNTKKSRMVSEFSEALTDLVAAGHSAVAKSSIIEAVLLDNVSEGVSMAIRTMLEDELANELDRYWSDVIREAATAIERPHHLVSAKFFKLKAVPETKDKAREYVVAFGNGRQKPASGVRFVPEGSTNDIYLAIALEKQVSRVEGVNKAFVETVQEIKESGALPSSSVAAITHDEADVK